MRLTRFLAATAVLAVGHAATPAVAQREIVQRAAVPEADELAGQMRSLAANPLDVTALIRAGELTLDMGDTTAAAAFFARAERIDPRNARIKAGLGGMLVLAERPGEALRRFAEAEALGRDPRFYAAQRGLAFDLVGQQERAQRDYRLALKTAPDDETVRRYALSLGISGQRDKALEQIDTLLRKSDRGAWRSRAFILAMTGDPAGASRIAASMMPAGMAPGLDPFFERLPQLSPADRAFAVHFGEVRATPQRLADARLAPAFPPLAPEPGRQLILASAVPMPTTSPRDLKAEKREAKRRKGKVQLAIKVEAPPVPLPQPPTYVAGSNAAPVAQQPPVSVAAVAPPVDRRVAAVRTARGGEHALDSVAVAPAPTGRTAQPMIVANAKPIASPRGGLTTIFASPADRTPPPVPDRFSSPAVAAEPLAADDNAPLQTKEAEAPATSFAPSEPVVTRPAPPPERRPEPTATPPAARVGGSSGAQRPPIDEESVLARIVANIVIPAAELAPARVAAAPAGSDSATTTAAERKLAAAKVAADKKALADKKAAAEKKAADKKAADIAKADPARIWVQVAGGANEGELAKEWAKVRDKAPAAFKGKSGWTTPLRATNRVLAGPFTSTAEARAFMNLIGKSSISAFVFTSAAGQKITKLPAK